LVTTVPLVRPVLSVMSNWIRTSLFAGTLRLRMSMTPVPLVPPLELFAVLDEGPYQHFGPEVVLEDGTSYRFYSEHQAERQSVLSFWNNLKNLSIQDVPDHSISTYLTRIRQKLPGSPPGR